MGVGGWIGFARAIACVLAVLAVAPAAVSAKPAGLTISAATSTATDATVEVRSRWTGKVVLERRQADGWRSVARQRVRRGRAEAITVALPAGGAELRARLRSKRAVSDRVRIYPPAPAEPAQTPPPSPPAETPAHPRVLTGFNNNSVAQGVATPDQAAAALDTIGAEVDRVQIDWRNIERTPGVYRFETFDRIYAADLARGIRPLFNLAYAPTWADGDACAAVTGTCLASPLPEFYDDYARALAAIAQRYPRAIGVEVWNEPNLPFFWRPAPDPAGYAALLAESYEAVNAVAPEMKVAGASIVDTSAVGAVGATAFLEAISDAGAAGAMDAISMHAYGGSEVTGGRAVQEVGSVRAWRDSAGISSTPIWITETGATTTGSGSVTEVVQASMVETLNRRLAAERDVEMLLFHTLLEPTMYGSGNRETGFGVLRPDFTPKLSGCVLAHLWGGLGDCPASLLG